ncbi:ECF transporter S component [Lysinibacillus piscis]|uniref:Membrane protein n=1 Tax=Lysinibacillus piscis TaxID=2518931 RepID=A0ABQ5NN11_9BACI|nr:ECF transporter S component [Lysinibacillus sp. KH24]GLC89630.1 membrane protein [Lysinibacillus sp. KH24]
MQQIQRISKTQNKTFDLVITAVLISLVFVATNFNIKLPISAKGGLVHLGTAMLFTISILFGPKKGAIAGAVGMGLFDIFGGWLIWAPITIVARGVQGYIVGKIAFLHDKKGTNLAFNITAAVVSIPVMVAVYYIGEVILYHNWVAPLASIPGDLVQNILGLVIAIPLCAFLKKVPYFKNI